MKSSLKPENLEKLFLFEIYAECMKINYPKLCITKNCLDSLKETVIQFQFLGFKPVEIREDEFFKTPGTKDYCGEEKIMTGKSCLFSLRDMPREIRCLEIGVTVTRNTETGSSLTLGVSSIRLGDKFADILKSLKPKMLSASVKKAFSLFDKNCNEVGKICVAISLSCFGKMITTSFQLDGEDSKAYVVQPGGEVPMADFLSKSEVSYDRGVCPGEPFGRILGGAGPPTPEPYGYQMTMGGYQGQPGLMGGTQATSENEESSSSSEELPPPQPAFQVCSCDFPLNPAFLPPPPKKKKKKKKKKNACPMSLMKDFCLNPACPKGYPALPVVEEKHRVCQAMTVPSGTFGLKGEQMVFRLPADNTPLPGNRNARFLLGGNIEKNLNDVRIMKDGEVNSFSTPTRAKDVFIMKVGKTNQETNQRHKMVLEIKQPKLVKDEKILCDIRTQYLEADFVLAPPKKKKPNKKGKDGKKGKKGKGKKGKKGKK